MGSYIKIGAIASMAVFACIANGQARNDASDKYLRVPLSAEWVEDSHFAMTLPTDDSWWKSFGDATLDSLISEGENNNFDVKVAMRRMEIARQAVSRAKSGYYPTVEFNGG